MNKTRLEMAFKDTDGKNFRIFLDNPRGDLEDTEVKEAMDVVIESDIFRNKNKSLETIESARVVRIEIEEFSL